ncbi:MAG: peptide chain release factor, partial [Lentisphaeria bacterium]|nr:peptide chain release factor [Lentisphaeria bacterium]
MERDAILALDDGELSRIVKLEFSRGSGNGGQKRNKTSTAVRVVLEEYGVAAADCSERSQHRNRAAALRKLRLALAL